MGLLLLEASCCGWRELEAAAKRFKSPKDLGLLEVRLAVGRKAEFFNEIFCVGEDSRCLLPQLARGVAAALELPFKRSPRLFEEKCFILNY